MHVLCFYKRSNKPIYNGSSHREKDNPRSTINNKNHTDSEHRKSVNKYEKL